MRLTNLDLAALRSFVTGIDAGSFMQAADRLGRSTSAVSAQLKKLEDQTGSALVRRAGRGLALTDQGELLLSYARRLLSLNDEAISALQSPELEGWVRLGIQEDFGETVLAQVLGQFARAHPRVRVEGRIGRNSELREKLASGHLDLALAWDDGTAKDDDIIASLPLCWLGPAEEGPIPLWQPGANADQSEPLPLAVLEAPCMLRTIACTHLDQHGIPWRIAFVSPSLGGMWAATAAGLGISLRTPFGHPASLRVLDPASYGLPAMPSLGLALLRAPKPDNQISNHLAAIIRQALQDTLPAAWTMSQLKFTPRQV
ncbi:LysR family transcriptional regulator [Thalassospira profundimaris]|uniref:LysR family transcriptional regulator n=1 Tax=Thalassospira profundimaris TaxID=502049 RepID=A0A367X016_9PROT|nr:LysR substrate-binding domain-containing protein [Thalassospira profundimaris]RCK47025.1 LysR family transcriptional regulator [Thalassospira profundimaris]